ncbi:hypothetical protein O181_089890 [Austropuccinia psidii MF-1]|uniref:Uncharacterized protein n=1 Tax=Austropuccinia psidii MF-1 TaxID=1389203 RepID=A0A9Q3P6I8_9BASI|nr:hypothetical protein [Austropuccinia psidii MF-1]
MLYGIKQSKRRNYNHSKYFQTTRITITIFKAHDLISSFTTRRPNTLPKSVNIDEQASNPSKQEILRNSTHIINIRPKDYSLCFYGKQVEIFIKRVENIAKIEGASGRDIARKISFWTKDLEAIYNLEETPGCENGDWKKLKLDMKRSCGTISPERT